MAWINKCGVERLKIVSLGIKKETLLYHLSLYKKRLFRIPIICSDMWRAYLKVIAKKASQTVHVLDRFHIVQHMNKALDKVLAAEVKQLLADGYEPILKGSRWLLLKRPANRNSPTNSAEEAKLLNLP